MYSVSKFVYHVVLQLNYLLNKDDENEVDGSVCGEFSPVFATFGAVPHQAQVRLMSSHYPRVPSISLKIIIIIGIILDVTIITIDT